jgi:hypothetical protein
MEATRRLMLFVAVVLAVGLAWAGDGLAQGSKGQAKNEILLSASSPFEDLTEFAIAGDKHGIERAIRAYDAQAPKVEAELPAGKRDELRGLVADIRTAAQKGDYSTVALKSPDAYRILVEALDRGALKVPVEVSLLDYAGFKFLALLHAKPTDWQALGKVAEEAAKDWGSVRAKVADAGLRDTVDVAVGGMKKACATKNAEMALFAAQVDLALVDLLEGYFEKAGK